MLAAVLSDTHMKAGSRRQLPKAAFARITRADIILHAGDVTDASLLGQLANYATVVAVLGNNDVGLELPLTAEVDLDGVAVAMVHDSGARAGREGRMKRLFPAAEVVVFGHSHIPWNDVGVDGQLLFNPGSPTERRRQPFCTMGLLECRGGVVTRHEVVRVDG